MSQEQCRAAANATPDDTRAVRVSECDDNGCACELVSVADISPGPVQDDEIINVIVRDRQHLLDDNKLHPCAVARVVSNGVSCLRDDAGIDQFHETIRLLFDGGDPDECFIYGVCQSRVAEIRTIEDRRQFLVLDTGLTGRKHHADIFAVLVGGVIGASEKKKRLKSIRQRLGSNIDLVATFRQGALARYARPATALNL